MQTITIRPVSDLRDYNKVLKECVSGKPVILTRYGRSVFVMLTMDEYGELTRPSAYSQTGQT